MSFLYPPPMVETPELFVRDIGTRFGVRVHENKFAEVHLIEGAVEVVSKRTKKNIMTLRPDWNAHFIPDVGEQIELPLEADPFPDLQKRLNAPPTYMTVIHRQHPTGYWRLEDRRNWKIHNEIYTIKPLLWPHKYREIAQLTIYTD